MKVDSVAPGSPAEKAGIAAGDILLRLDGRTVADLRTYSNILRELEPGQKVSATLLRENEEIAVQVVVEAR